MDKGIADLETTPNTPQERNPIEFQLHPETAVIQNIGPRNTAICTRLEADIEDLRKMDRLRNGEYEPILDEENIKVTILVNDQVLICVVTSLSNSGFSKHTLYIQPAFNPSQLREIRKKGEKPYKYDCAWLQMKQLDRIKIEEETDPDTNNRAIHIRWMSDGNQGETIFDASAEFPIITTSQRPTYEYYMDNDGPYFFEENRMGMDTRNSTGYAEYRGHNQFVIQVWVTKALFEGYMAVVRVVGTAYNFKEKSNYPLVSKSQFFQDLKSPDFVDYDVKIIEGELMIKTANGWVPIKGFKDIIALRNDPENRPVSGWALQFLRKR